MGVNPNWPTLFAEGEFALNPCFAQATTLVYTDLTPRLYKGWSTQRGRQYELDQIQPGEYNGQWLNRDGALDPTNASSPFSSGVVPYRGYRVRAQYPPSINLLSGDVATGGEVTPLAANSTLGAVTGTYGTPSVTVSGSAWQGTQVWQLPVTSTTTGSALITFGPVPVRGGQVGLPYTFSAHVRSATSAANPTVQPFLTWLNVSGASISTTTATAIALTGSTSAGWAAAVVPDVVPSGAVAARFGVNMTVAAGTWSFQADGIQFEQNATASTFSTPGANYPIYTGLTERYPQSWTNQGTYGLVTPVGVDVLAPLSQDLLREAFIMDVNASSPTWFYPLNDPSGATTFAEQAGRYPVAGLFSSSNGAGTLTVGNSITSAIPAGTFVGTGGPIVSVNNPTQNQGTVVDLTPAGIVGPPAGAWTRMIAFRSTMTFGLPTFAAYSNGVYPAASPTGLPVSAMYWDMQVLSGTNMGVAVSLYNDAGQHFGVAHPSVVNDGNWHLAFVQMSADGKTIVIWVDGVLASATGSNDMHAMRATNESIGGDEYKLSSTVGYGASNFVGDVAMYAQWTGLLNSAEMQSLYTSWRNAWQGDSTNARYARILGWAGYVGPSSVGAGSTTSIGPATDVAGTDVLTALNNVVDTEAGRHFVAADGTVTFHGRKVEFANTTPLWTFGENSGEIPYTNLRFDYDPTHLSNSVAVTQTPTSQVFNAADTTSQAAYGPRTLTRNTQTTDAGEALQSAHYWLTKYSQPALRVSALRIDVAANPALFPSVLAFEIGQRVRINRRDPTGLRPTITTDGYIEQVTHTADSALTWVVDLEVSPAPAAAYGIFTTLATTLNSGASAGATSFVINALPDSATNPAAGNLTGGQQLTVGIGASLEVVTIASGGVQATSPGYTTATIKPTVALAHNHVANEPVQAEANPQYYTASIFGSAQFGF